MLTNLTTLAITAHPHPGPGWEAAANPGWWVIFPILFWVAVFTGLGYLIYRRTPRQQARAAAERVLAEQFARGEISEEELIRRRAVLRGKA
mgnify:CR=1 FL=1